MSTKQTFVTRVCSATHLKWGGTDGLTQAESSESTRNPTVSFDRFHWPRLHAVPSHVCAIMVMELCYPCLAYRLCHPFCQAYKWDPTSMAVGCHPLSTCSPSRRSRVPHGARHRQRAPLPPRSSQTNIYAASANAFLLFGRTAGRLGGTTAPC